MFTVLEDLPDGNMANCAKISIKYAIIWAEQAWTTKVTCWTIQNCLRKTKLLNSFLYYFQDLNEGAWAICTEEEVFADYELILLWPVLPTPFWPHLDIKTKNRVKLVSWGHGVRQSHSGPQNFVWGGGICSCNTVKDELDPDDENISEIKKCLRPLVKREEARRHFERGFSFLW